MHMSNNNINVARPHTNNIAYMPGHKLAFSCKDPRCMGWDDCIATYNKKAGTLAVECTLCGHRETARLF